MHARSDQAAQEMIMRPTTTYPDTLDFLPKAAENETRRGSALAAVIRKVLGALRDTAVRRPR